MSKDTPEVGDVWGDEYDNRVFISYGGKSIILFYILVIVEDLMLARELTKSRKEFLDEYTYLGKSKANIDDLFKTENE